MVQNELISEDKTKFLDFEKSKVQILTLEQLADTKREKNSKGEPMMGIYHINLMNKVLDMAREAGYTPEVYDLFAAHNRDRYCPGVSVYEEDEAIYGEKAVKATTLRRVFANIRLRDFDDDENTTNIAVAFHQRGIQFGFGSMVKICHNQCMLSPDEYVATYSDKGRAEGTPLGDCLKIVGGWLQNARERVMADREKLEKMKTYTLSYENLMGTLGVLESLRVKADAPSNSPIRLNATYPLNNTQINDFAADMLTRFATKSTVTLYDMYDAATNLYKATSMDIPALLPQNRAFVEMMDERFAL